MPFVVLLFYGGSLKLLLMQRYLTIKHPTNDAVWHFGQFLRLLYVIQQSDVSLSRHVFDCLRVRRLVHMFVQHLLHIVWLELVAFCCVVRDVASSNKKDLKQIAWCNITSFISRSR